MSFHSKQIFFISLVNSRREINLERDSSKSSIVQKMTAIRTREFSVLSSIKEQEKMHESKFRFNCIDY